MHNRIQTTEILMKYLLPLTLFACSEYNLNPKGGSNYGGESGGGLTSNGSFESFTDGLTEEDELNAVTGRICSPDGGEWLVNAYVYAEIDLDDDGNIDYVSEDYTDGDGHYMLDNLPEGKHLASWNFPALVSTLA